MISHQNWEIKRMICQNIQKIKKLVLKSLSSKVKKKSTLSLNKKFAKQRRQSPNSEEKLTNFQEFPNFKE
jgi:hypothetical protein